MNLNIFLSGCIVICSLWVLWACAKRLNLMHWREHDPRIIAAYVGIGLWAFGYVLPIPELRDIGIIAVALLFFAGRKRWLTKAPDETTRAVQ